MSDQLSSFGASDSGLLNMFLPWTPASPSNSNGCRPRESKLPEQVPPSSERDHASSMSKYSGANAEEAAQLAEVDERLADVPLPDGFMSRLRSWVSEL